MKEIKLIPDVPLHNYVEISVMDFPDGTGGEPRRRCKIKAEFAQFDVEQLQNQGLSYEQAIKTYKEWLYDVVKFHLAQDWQCIDGYDQVMKIIEERVSSYY